MATRRMEAADNVRMGPLALFTLMAVMGLAVLAVLAITTANATLSLAQRRASATSELYLDETAAQTFTAVLDEALATGTSSEDALAAATRAATEAGQGRVDVAANQQDGAYAATFDCGNGRQLIIALTYRQDGTLGVEEWRMTTVVNEEPAMGELFGSSSNS